MGFNEPCPNGWEGPRTEPRWQRQGNSADTHPRPPLLSPHQAEEKAQEREWEQHFEEPPGDVW